MSRLVNRYTYNTANSMHTHHVYGFHVVRKFGSIREE